MTCFVQAAGTKGKRYAMPSTRIMMHQPAGMLLLLCSTCLLLHSSSMRCFCVYTISTQIIILRLRANFAVAMTARVSLWGSLCVLLVITVVPSKQCMDMQVVQWAQQMRSTYRLQNSTAQ